MRPRLVVIVGGGGAADLVATSIESWLGASFEAHHLAHRAVSS
jgi:hypothetical protein